MSDVGAREQKVQEATKYLTDRELTAYRIWRGTDRPSISKNSQEALFRLFLNGQTCEAIRAQNPQFTLGDIVAARVEWAWDAARDDYRKALMADTSARLQQATLASVGLMCDLLSVADLQHGTQLRKYMQSRDLQDLKGVFSITNLKDLKAVAEALAKLRGVEERPRDLPGHSAEQVSAQLPASDQPVTAEAAAGVLRLLLGRDPATKEN